MADKERDGEGTGDWKKTRRKERNDKEEIRCSSVTGFKPNGFADLFVRASCALNAAINKITRNNKKIAKRHSETSGFMSYVFVLIGRYSVGAKVILLRLRKRAAKSLIDYKSVLWAINGNNQNYILWINDGMKVQKTKTILHKRSNNL